MKKDNVKEIDGANEVTITIGVLEDRSKVVLEIKTKGGGASASRFRLMYSREETAQIAHAMVQAASSCQTMPRVPMGKVLQLPS